jgi:hypothetical protein
MARAFFRYQPLPGREQGQGYVPEVSVTLGTGTRVSFKSVGEGCVTRRQGGVDNKADR